MSSKSQRVPVKKTPSLPLAGAATPAAVLARTAPPLPKFCTVTCTVTGSSPNSHLIPLRALKAGPRLAARNRGARR